MLQLGTQQQLRIARETDFGLFLENEQGDEVLLPNAYVPSSYEIGDNIKVFLYLDNEERPTATTQEPYITLDNFAWLECREVNNYGAFMDWGLVKQLFVPFREQARPMVSGRWYIVRLYLDEKTNRLVGSSRTNRFLDNKELTVEKFDKVHILVSHITDKGANVIVNNRHKGLIHNEDLFEELRTGDRLEAYVRKVRHDNKLDIVLHSPGFRSIEPNAQYVFEELQNAGGFLPLHDKSSPEEIRDQLGISKKSFKKAIGSLYKDQKINIREDGIELKS
jgi:predicted RNA-binding protein (virulence factor B family)